MPIPIVKLLLGIFLPWLLEEECRLQHLREIEMTVAGGGTVTTENILTIERTVMVGHTLTIGSMTMTENTTATMIMIATTTTMRTMAVLILLRLMEDTTRLCHMGATICRTEAIPNPYHM